MCLFLHIHIPAVKLKFKMDLQILCPKVLLMIIYKKQCEGEIHRNGWYLMFQLDRKDNLLIYCRLMSIGSVMWHCFMQSGKDIVFLFRLFLLSRRRKQVSPCNINSLCIFIHKEDTMCFLLLNFIWIWCVCFLHTVVTSGCVGGTDDIERPHCVELQVNISNANTGME